MKLAQLATALSLVAAKDEVDAKAIVQLVDGFVHGALNVEHLADIEKCVTDAEVVFKDAESAYNHFKAKDIKDVVAGFKDVSAAISEIKVAMKDCSSTKADWDKLELIAEMFKSPKSLAWHIGKDIWHNGEDITSRMGTSIEDYEAKNWQDFGFQCGAMAAEVFVSEESQYYLKKAKKEKAAAMFQGILEPFGGHFNLQNLLMCIHDEDQALLMADIAVQNFETAYQKKDITDAIGGVVAIVGAIKMFQQGLPTCEAVDTSSFDYKQFNDAIDIAVHPTQHFELINNDLKMHGQSILEDIGSGVEAYRAGDLETFGKKMGQIVHLATAANAMKDPVPQTYLDTYPKDNREMVTEVLSGLLESTNVGTFNFTNLLMCVYEADGAALSLYQAVEVLEKAYKDKDAQEAIGGVIGIVAFVQAAKQALPVCEAVDSSSANWKNFNKIAKMSKCSKMGLKMVGENITMNGATVTSEIMGAMKAFENQEYKKFGSLIGGALDFAATPKDMFLY